MAKQRIHVERTLVALNNAIVRLLNRKQIAEPELRDEIRGVLVKRTQFAMADHALVSEDEIPAFIDDVGERVIAALLSRTRLPARPVEGANRRDEARSERSRNPLIDAALLENATRERDRRIIEICQTTGLSEEQLFTAVDRLDLVAEPPRRRRVDGSPGAPSRYAVHPVYLTVSSLH